MADIYVTGSKFRTVCKHIGPGWFVSLLYKGSAIAFGVEVFKVEETGGRGFAVYLGVLTVMVGWTMGD